MGGNINDQEMDEKFYKFGVKPEWLIVHRVINHRTMRDGRTLYLVKVFIFLIYRDTSAGDQNQICHMFYNIFKFYIVYCKHT